MLIEIHMIQNHAPSNLNRDDTGSPKSCVFGGVRRARISSQALKRAIRTSDLFTLGLGTEALAVRTRLLPIQVKEILLARGMEKEMAEIGAIKVSGFGTKKGTEQKKPETSQMMFLTPADIEAVADVILQAGQEAGTPAAFKKIKVADLQKKARDDGLRLITPDVALFGRMTTSDAFRDIQASIQVAHAISTHRMEHEFDYFTAVDDLVGLSHTEDDKGAGMIGDVEFTSACFYKYISIDLDGYLVNLGIIGEEAFELAKSTVVAFLRAAVFSTPSGKQNTFAAHQLADGILVEIRPQKMPISYANAFVQPVVPSKTDLVDASLLAFKDHVEKITRKFSLQSVARLWFTTREMTLEDTMFCETLDDLITKMTLAIGGGDLG